MEDKQSYALITIVIIAILAIVAGVFWYTTRQPNDDLEFVDVNMERPANDERVPTGETENLVIYIPRSNERVGTPIVIEGQVRGAEASRVDYRLLDDAGAEVASGFVTAGDPGTDGWGRFRGELIYLSENDGGGTLEISAVLETGETGTIIIPVRYTATPEFIKA